MTIGDVFARAWDLWRRSVLWLILAGLVVGVIIGVMGAILWGILAALIAGAGSAVVSDSLSNSTSSLSGFGIGLGITGFLVAIVGGFLIEVVAFTFYGGLFEMVIGAYRQQRSVEFGDLFSGFRKFGSYALYAAVLAAIQFGLGLLNFLPFVGWLISLVVTLWITIIWLYVLPLIADHSLNFMEAAGRSRRMVSDAGWWWTFGMWLLVVVAAWVVVAVIFFLAVKLGQSSAVTGAVLGVTVLIVFAVLYAPYYICYVSVLYVGSGGDVVAVPAGGGMGIPPAPPAPPAYGGQTTFGAQPTYSMPPGPPASADAWKAAADPLASAPPPPLAPGGQAPATPAVDATAVTQAPSAGDVVASAPDMPEPPAPPAPPGT